MHRRKILWFVSAPISGALLLAAHGCGNPDSANGGGDGSSDVTTSDVVGDGSSNEASTPSDGGFACTPEIIATNLAAAKSKIQHVIIINQENRSFDHYFGTFPGADGIPMDSAGNPTVCNIDPDGGACVKPFHSAVDMNTGGPHGSPAFIQDVADGGMSGFVASASGGSKKCGDAGEDDDPKCTFGSEYDPMSYHTDQEIPNYWGYAKKYVLQDHMFEPVASYSLPDHLYMVSGWSASCSPQDDAMACTTDLDNPGKYGGGKPEYAWTDITWLLHKHGVSWNYYVASGDEPDCEDGEMECSPLPQKYTKPGFWNILPWFDDVKEDNEVANVADTNDFFTNIKNGKLGAISWLIPSGALSEHPPNLVTRGQAYVTEIINAVMQSPYWDSTVIFLTWDDWGGFYDHVPPIALPDGNGYGIRVPGMTISPWAISGLIDKTVLSHDAYLKFIEDVFLNGERLDDTSGRPDDRPSVREIAPELGNLLCELDFTQTPAPGLVQNPCPTGVDTIYSSEGPCQP